MSAPGGVRRALIAVADKAGVVELARELTQLGVEIVSSGGTAAALRDAGIDVTAVSEVTGSPEMFGGRVKTLHPRIHGGILADRRRPEHVRELEEHGIEPFDLVVVNLYPFRRAVASGAEADEAIENIDVGGPAIVRAALPRLLRRIAPLVQPDRERAEPVERLGAGLQDLLEIVGRFPDRLFEQGEEQLVLRGKVLVEGSQRCLRTLDDLEHGEVRAPGLPENRQGRPHEAAGPGLLLDGARFGRA